MNRFSKLQAQAPAQGLAGSKMGSVSDFESELTRRAKAAGRGRWFKVDLHNHTPASHDYRGVGGDLVERIGQRIEESDLSIVMFTDHERLPDPGFIAQIQQEVPQRVLLRGVELNVFVDAFDSKQGKVEKEVFYHLLIGFDPNGRYSPEYWLEHLYRECRAEQRPSGSIALTGVPASPDEIQAVLRESQALIIPAHLHTIRDPLHSRSVDDIYGDRTFLDHAAGAFTALEVVDPDTAAFFDGKHPETNNLLKACVRSSDSHEPAELGRRVTWVEMGSPSYLELKAAFEMPFRTSLVAPGEASAFVVGMRIQGAFFADQWISVSPYCNMLIGVKGSGKTSVLECLRFALGAAVPSTRAEPVAQHLNAILGSAGKVSVLVKRADGTRLLVERSQGDPLFHVTFPDDRRESFSSAEALGFPTHILGWHEIEQAATDPHIRRVYMDTIAGRGAVAAFEDEAKTLSARIRERHTTACQRYAVLRDVTRQADQLQELRRGLQELDDAKLIELRTALQIATEEREAVLRTVDRLDRLTAGARETVLQVLVGQERRIAREGSVLTAALEPVDASLAELFGDVDRSAETVNGSVDRVKKAIQERVPTIEGAYSAFVADYQRQVAALSPEQQRLLETHREVLERTKALGSLEAEKSALKEEMGSVLRELADLCGKLAKALDERTSLRRNAAAKLSDNLSPYGVRLSVKEQERSQEFQELSSRYGNGATRLTTLSQRLPARLASLCLRSAYGLFAGDFSWDLGDVLFDVDIGYFVSAFENDDLKIELKVGKPGEEFSALDRLSAGQRCTAIFPILLEIGEGVLVVDQPEDNLDNRHIAGVIAPALLAGKMKRQMMFTSHNANLVVLSDAEVIMMFESDGSHGRVDEQGFFATSSSRIARHVIDVLDGGDRALSLRAVKYGLGTRH